MPPIVICNHTASSLKMYLRTQTAYRSRYLQRYPYQWIINHLGNNAADGIVEGNHEGE